MPPKKRTVPVEVLLKKPGTFAVLRDSELCAIGLSKEEAKSYFDSMMAAYPDANYSIVPGGEVLPGNKEKSE